MPGKTGTSGVFALYFPTSSSSSSPFPSPSPFPPLLLLLRVVQLITNVLRALLRVVHRLCVHGVDLGALVGVVLRSRLPPFLVDGLRVLGAARGPLPLHLWRGKVGVDRNAFESTMQCLWVDRDRPVACLNDVPDPYRSFQRK